MKRETQTTCEVLKIINETYLMNRMNYIKSGNRYSEPTITDEIIYLIQESQPVDSLIFHSKNEPETGADIEWWFWDYKFNKGIGTRIQSKRMYDDGNYHGLNHIVGENGKQVDILINRSLKEGMLPLYFFYNFLTKDKELPIFLFGNKYHWTFSFGTIIKEVIEEQILKRKLSDSSELVISPGEITIEYSEYEPLVSGMDSVLDLPCRNSSKVLDVLKDFLKYSKKNIPNGFDIKDFELDRFIKQTKDIPRYVSDIINGDTQRLNSVYYPDLPKFVIVTDADLSGLKNDIIKNN